MRNHRLITATFWLLLALAAPWVQAQEALETYHRGQLRVYVLQAGGLTFKCAELPTFPGRAKAGYFAQNGGAAFEAWDRSHRYPVLGYLAVGFTRDWETDLPPLGLSLQAGRIVNRQLDPEMDGLVWIDRQGRLQALDLEAERFEGRYDLRKKAELAAFLRLAREEHLSCFQTQLLYSAAGGEHMGPRKYGKRSPRRFLAICLDAQGRERQLILDLAAARHLNDAGRKALQALQQAGWQVQYLLNQDTGSRDIFALRDERNRYFHQAPVDREHATQLLLYYLN